MPKCYMCNNEATSKEHVPPKCLFPEAKDVDGNIDFRKNLITVPSCDAHNSAKSEDDEYLMFVLNFTITSQGKGKDFQIAKIKRAIEKKPNLIKNHFQNPQAVTVVDEKEVISKTAAFELDRPKFDRALEHISRAIFFDEFGTSFDGKIEQHCHFLLAELFGLDAKAKNAKLQEASEIAEKIFIDCVYKGTNQEIFRYKLREIDGSKNIMLLMEFYENSQVSVNFSPS